MNPDFTAHLTVSHGNRADDGLERELVTYRTPADRLSHRMLAASRHHLAMLFLAIGERLGGKQPETANSVAPVRRTTASR